jgi:hypothetical protein
MYAFHFHPVVVRTYDIGADSSATVLTSGQYLLEVDYGVSFLSQVISPGDWPCRVSLSSYYSVTHKSPPTDRARRN